MGTATESDASLVKLQCSEAAVESAMDAFRIHGARGYESAGTEGLVDVLGPSAAPIARLRGRYRFRVMLRARERAPLRATTAHVARVAGELPDAVRAVVDVDPVSML